ncbi:MAG: hypothetical protein HY544_05580 [Candidatus Diapherotrites archaeon]|uniref:Uncharacterized protein n=1 Tax=Candidatus Iainarchaeum sp. TaxID=3101447 RepID=A0A8T3YMD3_9ARCH|nr:hypothetical protein [Candidatus Diapherotrites archaeon]
MRGHPDNKFMRRAIGLRKDASRGMGRLTPGKTRGDKPNFGPAKLPFALRNREEFWEPDVPLKSLKRYTPPLATDWKPSAHKFWKMEEQRREPISGRKTRPIEWKSKGIAARPEKYPAKEAIREIAAELGIQQSPERARGKVLEHLRRAAPSAAKALSRAEPIERDEISGNWRPVKKTPLMSKSGGEMKTIFSLRNETANILRDFEELESRRRYGKSKGNAYERNKNSLANRIQSFVEDLDRKSRSGQISGKLRARLLQGLPKVRKAIIHGV